MKIYLDNYYLNNKEILFSALTFTGGILVKRHWDLSNQASSSLSKWGHRVVATIEAVPFLGGLVALIEIIAARCLGRNSRVNRLVTPFTPLQELRVNASSSSANKRIESVLDPLFEKRAKELFWIPHPKFEGNDFAYFPESRVNFFDFNSSKEISLLLGMDKATRLFSQYVEDLSFGGNVFLKWLNGNTPSIDKEKFFQSREECFMNCSDFVYLILYQADLISKEKITSIYRKMIQCQLNGIPSNAFYGFDLSIFKEFDPQDGSKHTTPQPGDLLIGFDKGSPIHILFLSSKDPTTKHWRGIGLWNMGDPGLGNPTQVELTKLQEECRMNKQSLTFKHCSLETALRVLHSQN